MSEAREVYQNSTKWRTRVSAYPNRHHVFSLAKRVSIECDEKEKNYRGLRHMTSNSTKPSWPYKRWNCLSRMRQKLWAVPTAYLHWCYWSCLSYATVNYGIFLLLSPIWITLLCFLSPSNIGIIYNEQCKSTWKFRNWIFITVEWYFWDGRSLSLMISHWLMFPFANTYAHNCM